MFARRPPARDVSRQADDDAMNECQQGWKEEGAEPRGAAGDAGGDGVGTPVRIDAGSRLR